MKNFKKIIVIGLTIAVVLGLAIALYTAPAATETVAAETATTETAATVPAATETAATVPVASDAPVTYDTVVGELVDEQGNRCGTITYGDLRSDEYLKVGFPNEALRNELQGALYDLLVVRTTVPETSLTAEKRHTLRELAFGIMGYYEPVNAPDTRLPLYYADILDEYRMYGFGDAAAKYLVNLRREADRQNLKAPEWVEYTPDYNAICVTPSFLEDMFSSTNTAVTAWLGDGEPEAMVTVENGATLALWGRFLDEAESGEYRFVGCWAVENAEYEAENAATDAATEIDPSSVIPCMIEVDYDKNADAFYVDIDFCQETLKGNRQWQGSYTDRLPQTYEDCFIPLYDVIMPVLDIPDGIWSRDYNLTCVFTTKYFIGMDDKFTNVDVYNAISKDGEGNMGCLVIREDGSNMWVENALFCEASFDTRKINTEDTLKDNDGIVTACDNLRLWCADADTPAVDVVVYADGTCGWEIR